MNEGFERNAWQKQVCNQRLSNKLQFDSLERAVQPQFNQGFHTHRG